MKREAAAMNLSHRLILAKLALVVIASSAPAEQREFVVSYWYGPPPKFTTIEHYRRIKEANFNVVFPPGPPDTSITREQNLRILDFCRELGLKAVIFDPRMPKSLAAPDAKPNIDAIVADYARHPALLAYFVLDEPTTHAFPALGGVFAYVKQRDPKHPAFVNLFPIHADPVTQLGAGTYEQYVDRFAKEVDPSVLSYDHYPFTKHDDNPLYFTNLAILRNASIATKRPFWNIAQLVQHYDYRALTEPELRFQAMQTLVFGAKGLLWYTYWYPGGPNPTVDHAMIAHDGVPTREYEWIKGINADVRAIGNELIHCESWATYHTGDPVQYAAPVGTPISMKGSGRYTTGVFHAPDGKTLTLLTNRDYSKAATAHVKITPASAAVEKFDPAAATRWSPAALDANGWLSVDLSAGGGVLLRWAGRP
jgi:hypothetical protein